jgi:L,D-transpeptidase ErfK/SrfK
MKIRTLFTCSLLLLAVVGNAYAATYNLPETSGDRVVASSTGETVTYTVDQDQTLLDVARRFNLGQSEIVTLNPKLDRWLIKQGTVVRLPNRRILPDSPHDGLTLNIAEYRMYYYPADQPGTVRSYAHGIGRQDWQTPLGKTTIVKKVKDPAWHPPESIRREHAAEGDPLPAVVPPGPNNPLGAYALYLNLPGDYRIHGTDVDKIYGIGMQITHGCVRMYPEDIEALYNSVPIGTPVYIVKQPVKVGWLNNVLYIEAHPDLEGEQKTRDQRFSAALELIKKANNGELPEFDQVALNQALKDLDGTPVPLYERLPPLEEEIPAAEPEPIPEIVPEPPVAKITKPTPSAVAASKKPAVESVAKSTKSGSVTAGNSKKQVPATTSKSKKQVPATTSKSKKQESVTAGNSKKQVPATTSKTKKQESITAGNSKKQVPATTSKTKKQASVIVGNSKKQVPATTSKTKKQESVTVGNSKKQVPATTGKSKKQEPATTSKKKKQATETAGKTQSQGSASGYYRGA